MFVNDTVIQRHAEDTGFLWSRRQRALRANQIKHLERMRIDMRLEGNVDGLRIAGEAGWRACLDELESWHQPGGVFAAAAVAFHDAHDGRVERILEIARSDERSFAPIVSALGWSTLATIEPLLARWARSEDPWLRRFAIAGLAAHRRSAGCVLESALRSHHTPLRAVAAKVSGELGAAEHLPVLRELLGDADNDVRLRAACTLARFHDGRAVVKDTLLTFCGFDSAHADRAAAALIRMAPTEGSSLFRGWARDLPSRPLAARAAEVVGDSELVPDLIAWMDDERTSRAAGEAFRVITGTCLREAKLERPRPSSVHADPTDNPDDEHVELDAEYDLAFPQRFKVHAWWRAHGESFVPGTRYLDGKAVAVGSAPLDQEHLDNLRDIAATGRPRNQTLAASALAQARPHLPVLETHAPATRVHAVPGWAAWAQLTVTETSVRRSRA